MSKLSLRVAVRDDKAALEAIQLRASLANAGDREAILANPDAIELSPEKVAAGHVFVAEAGGRIIGFASILARQDGDADLDDLFVEPDLWRQGIGRVLVDHCCDVARSMGATALHVIGNPHAEAFYRACGFELVGTQQMRFGIGLLMKRAVP
jgi:GNAT superfamily N-acetyltransferase